MSKKSKRLALLIISVLCFAIIAWSGVMIYAANFISHEKLIESGQNEAFLDYHFWASSNVDYDHKLTRYNQINGKFYTEEHNILSWPFNTADVIDALHDDIDINEAIRCKADDDILYLPPIYFADKKERVEKFIELGVDVNQQTDRGNSPLIHAIKNNNLALLSTLLEHGADPELANASNEFPLLLSILKNDYHAAKDLVKQGAKVNRKDILYDTPLLHHVIAKNNKDIFDLFFSENYDLNVLDKFDNSALHVAANHGNIYFVEKILGKYKNINKTNKKGASPLHLSVNSDDSTPLLTDKIPDFSLNMTDYGEEDDEDFIDAAEKHQEILVKRIKRIEKIITLLINKGIDPKLKNNDGNTALHLAVMTGQVEFVKLLCEKAPQSINIVNHYDQSPLSIAIRSGHVDICKVLLSYSKLNNQADLGQALFYVVQNRRMEIFNELIKYDLNFKIKDDNDQTLLHQANDIKMFNALIKKGLDVNAQDYDGDTPLHIFTAYKNTQFIQILYENGANPTIKNAADLTPEESTDDEATKNLLKKLSKRYKLIYK